MAREMPVLPLVGSRIVAPGCSEPSFSAASTIAMAARCLIDPVRRICVAESGVTFVDLVAATLAHGLVPILEPEVSINSPDKAAAETILRAELLKGLEALPEGSKVMIKLTIPDVADFYRPLIEHPAVVRVVALSGGYARTDACNRLAKNHGMIASFSRALINELKKSMSDSEFDATLATSIDEIYQASVEKVRLIGE